MGTRWRCDWFRRWSCRNEQAEKCRLFHLGLSRKLCLGNWQWHSQNWSLEYKIEGDIHGGCQTETSPGKCKGIDFSKYKMIKATLTNKGKTDVHWNIVLKTGNGWKWQENAGTNTLGKDENKEQIIYGGNLLLYIIILITNFGKHDQSICNMLMN